MAVFQPAVAWNNSQLKQRNDFDLMESIKLDSIAKPVKKVRWSFQLYPEKNKPRIKISTINQKQLEKKDKIFFKFQFYTTNFSRIRHNQFTIESTQIVAKSKNNFHKKQKRKPSLKTIMPWSVFFVWLSFFEI